MSTRWLVAVAACAVLRGICPESFPDRSPSDDAIRQAYDAAYNLDYDRATSLGRRAVSLGPAESRTHRTLASMLWLQILFKRGAFTVDHYLSGGVKSPESLPKPPFDLETEFRVELAKAISLADAAAANAPRDADALHDVGAAYAIQASYLASVQGNMFDAFQSARRAYDTQERVLERQPDRADATMIVGTYRYIVSALSLPARLLAYLAGFGGGRELGISLLEKASRDAATHVDARVALILVYSREERHADAGRVASELSAEFPRNRIFVFEAGSAAIRGARAAEADEILTRGLTMFERDTRPKIPGERALWLYKRGMARVMTHRVSDALTDLDAALKSQPMEWVVGRVHLELGKIADLGGRRADAIAEYRRAAVICERNNDPAFAEAAAALIKRPYSAIR